MRAGNFRNKKVEGKRDKGGKGLKEEGSKKDPLFETSWTKTTAERSSSLSPMVLCCWMEGHLKRGDRPWLVCVYTCVCMTVCARTQSGPWTRLLFSHFSSRSWSSLSSPPPPPHHHHHHHRPTLLPIPLSLINSRRVISSVASVASVAGGWPAVHGSDLLPFHAFYVQCLQSFLFLFIYIFWNIKEPSKTRNNKLKEWRAREREGDNFVAPLRLNFW